MPNQTKKYEYIVEIPLNVSTWIDGEGMERHTVNCLEPTFPVPPCRCMLESAINSAHSRGYITDTQRKNAMDCVKYVSPFWFFNNPLFPDSAAYHTEIEDWYPCAIVVHREDIS